MKYFHNILIVIVLLVFSMEDLQGQTCCSGGIPIAGNLAFENNRKNAWQFGLMGDVNELNTLKSGEFVLKNQTSERDIYSLLFRTGYNITDNLVGGAVIPLVRQERRVTSGTNIFYSFTQGLGDIILFSQYQIPVNNLQNTYQVGMGWKLPTGDPAIKSQNGISYNMDMQPGSGSSDILFWGSYEHSFSGSPDLTLFTQLFYRLNGKYGQYLGDESYHFGNEWQIIPGLSKQWFISNQLFNTSVLLKLRNMKPNEINSSDIANTGGFWFYAIPSITYHFNQQISVSLAPEIPVYSDLQGTQLTTTFRIRGGVSVNLNQPSTVEEVKLKPLKK